jgi:hypothetical protein
MMNPHLTERIIGELGVGLPVGQAKRGWHG